MALTVTVEIVALMFAYIVVFVLMYKKHKLFGDLMFTGLGITSFVIENVNPSTSIILVIVPLMSLVYDWLNQPKQKPY